MVVREKIISNLKKKIKLKLYELVLFLEKNFILATIALAVAVILIYGSWLGLQTYKNQINQKASDYYLVKIEEVEKISSKDLQIKTLKNLLEKATNPTQSLMFGSALMEKYNNHEPPKNQEALDLSYQLIKYGQYFPYFVADSLIIRAATLELTLNQNSEGVGRAKAILEKIKPESSLFIMAEELRLDTLILEQKYIQYIEQSDILLKNKSLPLEMQVRLKMKNKTAKIYSLAQTKLSSKK